MIRDVGTDQPPKSLDQVASVQPNDQRLHHESAWTPEQESLPAPMQESRRYRLKHRLLGPPLETERLEHERLGKPTALAVFASDNLSSSAYATEEILHVLVPVVGVAAFGLVTPISIAMLLVLALLILSYRQTIKAYPSAGGAYIVTRDNFGIIPAQVAGVALLTDYILTVAVSVAAGTAALTSVFDFLTPWRVVISLVFIAIIAFGNLRGVRESGAIFAAPTYFFILNMALLLGLGAYKYLTTGLPKGSSNTSGMLPLGTDPLIWGFAGIALILHAFASGGAAVTGVEAISNGVTAFRRPEWKNARQTLVAMGLILGVMFLGLSLMAGQMHIAPFSDGTPTVMAQISQLIHGDSPLGHVLFFSLQLGTMLILVLAANTSFADFPRLASFEAGDYFMPKQLTKRGHRLVYSNGIIFLAVAAAVLVIVTGAKVSRLIPLYAIGVFASFTMSQAGMTRHHLRERERGWRMGLTINGTGAVISFVVCLIIAVTKFTHGAWLIVVFVPVMVLILTRLNRQYESEIVELEHEVTEAVESRILPHHTVLVLCDRLTRSTARAIQYARGLMPDELRAVHVALDPLEAKELARVWRELPTSRIQLQIVDCPDRRVPKCVAEVVAAEAADGQTEVSVLIPRREYRKFWHRLLHDHTADEIADVMAHIPHANVTFVPFQLGNATPKEWKPPISPEKNGHEKHRHARSLRKQPPITQRELEPETVPINQAKWRSQVTVVGKVVALRVKPWNASTDLEITLQDGSGRILVIFNGRRSLPGIDLGTRVRVEGIVSENRHRLAFRNPAYWIQPHE